MQMMKPEQFQRWAARANPGDDVVYATGLRPGETISAAVRALRERGVVTTTSKRVDGEFRFIAQRLPDLRPSQVRARTAEHRGRFARREPSDRGTAETVIYRLLRAAAAGDRPCPTNAKLAKQAGLSGAASASYRVRRLVAAGRIIVAEPSPIERRVVTIVATGKSTRRALL